MVTKPLRCCIGLLTGRGGTAARLAGDCRRGWRERSAERKHEAMSWCDGQRADTKAGGYFGSIRPWWTRKGESVGTTLRSIKLGEAGGRRGGEGGKQRRSELYWLVP